MGEEEFQDNGCVSFVFEKKCFSTVVSSEVAGSVCDDTGDGDTKSLVESTHTVRLEDFHETVVKSVELSRSSGSDVGSESGSGEIQGVHEAQGGGSGSTTTGQVSEEEFESVGLGVVGVEGLLKEVFERKVKSLGGEVSDHVG